VLALDRWLFAWINAKAGHWPWLDALARLFLNDYMVPTLLAAMLIALWFEGRQPTRQLRNQRAVLVATLGTILANGLLKISNLLYHRPRPFADQPVNLLFYQPTDSSLPSNAAAIGFAIAAGVWLHNRSWGLAFGLIALLFSLSRIFGGVHFPLDILSGAVLGWLSVWLVQSQGRWVDALLRWLRRLATKFSLS
jgi:undecaprenyl-diphosphatase